jgi:SAM-dependent methyltransferase
VIAAATAACGVCGTAAPALDVVDFNKSCEEARGFFLPQSGQPVYYHRCPRCGFCFAPEIAAWPLERFAERIYNSEYVAVDPDYVERRPAGNAVNLQGLFGNRPIPVRHLDFGGGDGLLSRALEKAGWQSTTYDPFVDRGLDPATLGRFGLITAFEVFEHVPDVRGLMATLDALLDPAGGVLLFTTLLSDGNIAPNARIQWWYASPRNGHISLFSQASLATLCGGSGYQLGSFNTGFHLAWKRMPGWAAHLLGKEQVA